ncbi:anthrone oxygenase family protein [Paenarthrobacter sp. NPDC089322]|uniref:anthrone oxygenase family protein n=1 Tax=Paenarthrobacter sp. NPDC089322 TaxID=3155065 RepID=UPI003425DE8C
MSGWLPMAAGVGSAAVGGFYFAFSALVMPALGRRPGKDAAAAMVSINQKAVTPPFMILFFGSAAASAAVVITAVVDPRAQPSLRVAGAAACLAGWVLSMAVNVPLNNRLAASGIPGVMTWQSHAKPWTRANHIRTALSIAGAVGLLVPLTP